MPDDVLLVIPAWREARRLPPYLRDLVSQLSHAPFETKILVVDDGSPAPEQKELLHGLQIGAWGACRVLEPILLADNHGKGYSIAQGWRAGGRADWFCFVDADGAISAAEVLRLLNLATSTAPTNRACLWASRIRMLGLETDRRLGRFLLGRLFANLVSQFIGLPVYDTQCGFKIVPEGAYLKIQPLLEEPRFCFDIELLLALHHVQASILEIPINWHEIPGGHVHAIRDGLAMLARLPAIQRRAKTWPIKGGHRPPDLARD